MEAARELHGVFGCDLFPSSIQSSGKFTAASSGYGLTLVVLLEGCLTTIVATLHVGHVFLSFGRADGVTFPHGGLGGTC